MHLTEASIINLFAPHILQRGRRYLREGRVELLEFDGEYLETEVQGTSLYFVQVEEKPKGLSYHCSCPFDGPCKHLAASLLSALETGMEPKPDSGKGNSFWELYFRRLAQADDFDIQPEWRLRYAFSLERGSWWLHPQKQKLGANNKIGKPQSISSTDFGKRQVVSREADKLVLSFLEKWRLTETNNYYYYTVRTTRYEFSYGAPVGVVLALLRDCPIVTESADGEEQLHYHTSRGKVEFRLVEQEGEDRLIFRPFLLLDEAETELKENFTVLAGNPIWLMFGGELVEIENDFRVESLLPFSSGHQEFALTRDQLPNFFRTLAATPDLFSAFRFPDGVETQTVTAFSEKRLYLGEQPDAVSVNLKFVYGAVEVNFHDARSHVWGMSEALDTSYHVIRDFEAEQAVVERLLEGHLKRGAGKTIQTYKNKAFEWMFEDVPLLLKEGFTIFGEDKLHKYRVNRTSAQVRVQMNSGIDWFDLDFNVDFGGVLLALPEIKKALKKKSRYVKLTDGATAALPEAWINRFHHAVTLGDQQDGRIRLSHFHVTLIDELFAEAGGWSTDEGFEERLQMLRDFSGIEARPVPKSLHGELRPYQKEGFDWLCFLQNYRFGGCLADDMGLGKTVQALTVLLHEAENGAKEPSLIVTPTSVVFNWMNEIERFAPRLKVLNQTGGDRKRVGLKYDDVDIVLTSYGTLRQDILFLKDIQFNYVILDESQNIKNPVSQTAKAAKVLKANHRLALTGTPVENNTMELWSLFSFLNPGLLGGLTYFKEAFARPIEKEHDEKTANLLRKTIYPFILRRSKGKVATELPPKVENLLCSEMLPGHQQVYNKWRDFYRASLLQRISDVGLNKSRMNVLEGLTRLRQIACHPALVEEGFNDRVSKFELLFDYLEEITAEGHKVLVFSQFVRMLTLIREKLDGHTPYAYLDGRTRDRQACVRKFEQDDACKVFLISLKAGGTGLNLTAAGYVIHYDPWWNPAVEMQATDRSHRIGQDKHVFVYKMVSKGTVEEKILQLQERKRKLVSSLISTDAGLFKNLGKDDIEELFS